jgi:hypothetical protein
MCASEVGTKLTIEDIRSIVSYGTDGAFTWKIDEQKELNGDELEFCFNDNIPNYIAASCTTFKRVK